MLKALYLPFFRNHTSLRLSDLPQHVILYGENGAGKTNVLEAISLFGQARGFRNAPLEELCPLDAPQQGFGAHLELSGGEARGRQVELTQLKTLFVPHATNEQKTARRRLFLNDEEIPQHALQRYLRLCWLLPQMGTFFSDGVATRRAWLDRIVAKNDPDHEQRLARHRVLLKERLAVLNAYPHETAWLDQLESKLAAGGVALTASRAEMLARLNAIIAEHAFFEVLLRLRFSLESNIARDLARHDALSAEAKLQARLSTAREQDRAEQRSREGAHRMHLIIENLSENLSWGNKPVEARLCSCGEQKSMLVSMLVAEALLLMGTALRKPAPVLLLDDFPAHLDAIRQQQVLHVLSQLGTQCFYTANDPAEGALKALCAKGFLLESRNGVCKARVAPALHSNAA